MVLDGVRVRALPTAAESGAMNMALDTVAAESVSTGGPASIRVYEWRPSTLSLGYAQASETVDWEYCENAGIEITRRPTGGGGIYHDAVGDIAYSIVAPRDVLPSELSACYATLCEPILTAFDRIGVDVDFASTREPAAYEPACYLRQVNPAHDMVVSMEGTERKISGNAQHRVRDAVVQHGSLRFQNEPEQHLACFADCPVDTDEFESRVTAINELIEIDRQSVLEILEQSLQEWAGAEPGTWTDAERSRARELVEAKFGHADWNRHRKDPISVT